MIFVEPFCGMAACSYRLVNKYGKPPLSYQGSKAGYAETILGILGLAPGQGASGIILGDAGPAVALHATLHGAEFPIDDVARFLHANALSMIKDGTARGYSRVNGEGNDFTDRHGEKGHWHATTPLVSASRLTGSRAAEVAAVLTAWEGEEPRALFDRLKAEGWPSMLPTEQGRWIGPCPIEEVAKFILTSKQSFSQKGAEAGVGELYRESSTPRSLSKEVVSKAAFPPLACWQGKAEELPLPEDLSDFVIFIDPPYQDTSPYPFGTCARSTVLELASRYHAAGAVVGISEAVPLAEVLGQGWTSVRLDHARKGAVRSFSKQQAEYLTINRTPGYIPPRQTSMFT